MKKILMLMAVVFFCCLVLCSGPPVETRQVKDAYDEDTYGPKDPIVWEKPVKAVVFNHKVHTMDAGLSCDSCHDDLFPNGGRRCRTKRRFYYGDVV